MVDVLRREQASTALGSRHPALVRHRRQRPHLRGKVAAYRLLADEHFETERYAEFVQTEPAGLDELAVDYFDSADFDRLLVETVQSTFPAHEHEQFVGHYRGLVAAWVTDAR